MSRHSWSNIYERELQRLLNQGMEEQDAMQLASDNADEIYWELVDQGRNKAKDHEGSFRRSRQVNTGPGDTE